MSPGIGRDLELLAASGVTGSTLIPAGSSPRRWGVRVAGVAVLTSAATCGASLSG